jgi:predicted dithiol-disulfide oxidoreductase (DUF899 family)
MQDHKIVTPGEWLAARRELLDKEKAFTRARDELSAARRALPWERVERDYSFEGPDGTESLSDLFVGRSQLLVYHFMLGPEWEQGCPSCSFWADSYDGTQAHLAQRDISLVAVSRAPLDKIEAYRKRMGWSFKWVSSYGSDFNYDMHVSFTRQEIESGSMFYNYEETTFPADEAPGVSVFYKDEDGELFHTYSTFARGLDILNSAYNMMDLVPKGRDEDGLPHTMSWLRRHDEYD